MLGFKCQPAAPLGLECQPAPLQRGVVAGHRDGGRARRRAHPSEMELPPAGDAAVIDIGLTRIESACWGFMLGIHAPGSCDTHVLTALKVKKKKKKKKKACSAVYDNQSGLAKKQRSVDAPKTDPKT